MKKRTSLILEIGIPGLHGGRDTVYDKTLDDIYTCKDVAKL